MNKTKNVELPDSKLRSVVTQSAMTAFFSPILITLLCLGLNFFSGSGNLDFSTFNFVAIALIINYFSDTLDAYSRIKGAHGLDIMPIFLSLKSLKKRSYTPSFSAMKQVCMVALTITVLGDLSSGYLTESVIVSVVPSVSYNEIALLIVSITTITIGLLSLVGKPTDHDISRTNKKFEIGLIFLFMIFGALSIYNNHSNFATATFKNDAESREIRVSYLVTSELSPSELLIPTIYGSEKLAIKLLSTLKGDDFEYNSELGSVVANALLSNAKINLEEEESSPTTSHLIRKKGYQEQDIESLEYFLSGDYEAYVNSCLKIIKLSKASGSRGSYAVSLLLHLVDGGLLKVQGIESKLSSSPISKERKEDIDKMISTHRFLSSATTKIVT